MVSETVLVVVAHPDDEVLGCGGTIARLAEEGRTVYVVVATDGVGARFAFDDGEACDRRDEEYRAACRVLGASAGYLNPDAEESFPDNQLDTVPLLTLVQHVERALEECKPSVVYTHHPGDLNIDHQLIARAVITATRPYPGQVVRAVYGFEVPGSTEWAVPGAPPFVPTRFVVLTEAQCRIKKAALGCYASELRLPPHPRSLSAAMALAEVRGSQCGHELAEAFTVIREVV